VTAFTDFFLATPEELASACKGWARPRETPELVVLFENPRTGETLRVPRWIDPAHPPSDPTPAPDLTGLRVLEQEDLDAHALVALARAAGLDGKTFDAELARPALTCAASYEGYLQAIPDGLVDVLATSDATAIEALGKRWSIVSCEDADAMNPATREYVLTTWTDSVCVPIAGYLAELARARQPGQRMYVSTRY
jgi:hypothetical protein